MNNMERRRHKRYPIYCPIEYKSQDDNPIDSSVTLNISEGGALISTKRILKPNTDIIVKMVLSNTVFFVRARVVHAEDEELRRIYNIGVEFKDNSLTFLRRYYEEIEAIMCYQRECALRTGNDIALPEASMKWYSQPH